MGGVASLKAEKVDWMGVEVERLRVCNIRTKTHLLARKLDERMVSADIRSKHLQGERGQSFKSYFSYLI